MSITRINNLGITDGTIVNADISASAAIASTKLTGVNDAKAWVNFNGTGTPAIRASFNVSSITDNGTGDYTVNFTTAMPDANYCVTFGGTKTDNAAAPRGGNFNAIDVDQFGTGNAPTTSALRVRSTEGSSANSDGAFIDVFYFYVAIFR